jgi:hypothetical protein
MHDCCFNRLPSTVFLLARKIYPRRESAILFSYPVTCYYLVYRKQQNRRTHTNMADISVHHKHKGARKPIDINHSILINK